MKEGDVYDSALLANLIQGQDAVISAFNPGWKDPNLYDDQVRGTASIIAAIKKVRHQASFVGRRSRRTGGQIGSARHR